MDKTKRLEQLYAKIKNGVVNMPWERLVDIHVEVYGLLYGMRFDGKTFYSDIHYMMQQNPGIAVQFERIAKIKGKLSGDDIQELPRIMVQYNYVQAGKKDFHVYSDLVPMLRDTDLPDLPASEIKFPFEAFSIVFKQGTIRGRGTKMDRIFVSCPDGEMIYGFLASDNYNGAPVFVSNLKGQPSLKEMLAKAGEVSSTMMDVRAVDVLRQDTQDAIQLLFNLLLYINCENADIQKDTSEADKIRRKLAGFNGNKKKTRKQKILEQELQKATKRNIYLVGKRLRADQIYGVKAVNEEGRKILKRFRVRGHFRNQPYGPELSLVKRKWIRPHWRGPDLAELINSGYVVKESTSGVKGS